MFNNIKNYEDKFIKCDDNYKQNIIFENQQQHIN